MKFSVVIPLYNKEYSINRCIDSVLSQTYPNYEIIIVDDGSTDTSLPKIKSTFSKEIKSERIKLLEQSNQGVSIARNNATNLATSNYICFLDADDEWLPNFLETMVKLIHDYPDASLYTLAFYVKKGNSKLVKSKRGLKSGHRGYVEDFFKSSSKGNLIHTSTACVLKETFISIGGFPEGVVAGEDLYLWIRFALTDKVACEENFLAVVYLQEDDSRSARNNSVPYPLVYFSENRDLQIPGSLNRYLFTIFYKHFARSVLDFKFKEAFLRLQYFSKTLKLSRKY